MSRIEKCQWGQLDQGLIFLGGTAEKYRDCIVHGILITARCDFAHNSTSVCTYLPIVSLSDWLVRDFVPIASERIQRIVLGKIREHLKNNNYSPIVLETLSPRKIHETLFAADATTRRKQEAAIKMLDLIEHYEFIESAALKLSVSTLSKMRSQFQKTCNEVLEECIRQKLNGFYFLDQIDSNGSQCGFVVLLREVKSMPIELANMIVGGLDKPGYEQLCVNHPSWKELIMISDFAFPIGKLRSPDIEHLMQSFTLLFGRIGIEDHEKGLAEKLWPMTSSSDRTQSNG